MKYSNAPLNDHAEFASDGCTDANNIFSSCIPGCPNATYCARLSGKARHVFGEIMRANPELNPEFMARVVQERVGG